MAVYFYANTFRVLVNSFILFVEVKFAIPNSHVKSMGMGISVLIKVKLRMHREHWKSIFHSLLISIILLFHDSGNAFTVEKLGLRSRIAMLRAWAWEFLC